MPLPPLPTIRDRSGFTLSEVLVSLTLGAILTGMAVLNPNGARSAYSISGAERAMGSLAARARAHAVERGTVVRFNVDPRTDSVWVSLGGELVAGQGLGTDFGVDLNVEGGSFHICYTPRGFADPSCSTSPMTRTIVISRAERSETLAILPLGQVEYRR